MSIRSLMVFTASLSLAVSSVACIWPARVAPPEQQLPPDLFKLHVHVATQPVELETSLLGRSSKVTLGTVTTDPKGDYAKIIAEFEAGRGDVTSLAARSDYAAALLYAHRYAAAVEALVALERDFPGKYATAANLGTAYELTGDVESAHRWIKTGIERNPASHEGTEWLHLAILETKQKQQTDAAWLSHHSVLDGHEARGDAAIEKALVYQLNERLYFIKDRDQIMCDLFYQGARLTRDPAKRKYFVQQTRRFGSIRERQLIQLKSGR